ncbi:MAG TPA: hypothetical protein VEB61_02430, partial [Candidatus Binatia bacterium]|nr:hypothetical protein [Candidatus Binatia bacterium]
MIFFEIFFAPKQTKNCLFIYNNVSTCKSSVGQDYLQVHDVGESRTSNQEVSGRTEKVIRIISGQKLAGIDP